MEELVNCLQYAGGWYDIEKTYFAGQMNKSCVKAEYSLRDDGKIDVLNQDYTCVYTMYTIISYSLYFTFFLE
jgi:lipocalin